MYFCKADWIFQEAANKMVERFVASGLMKQEYDRVKLHCTLINSLFRKVKHGLT